MSTLLHTHTHMMMPMVEYMCAALPGHAFGARISSTHTALSSASVCGFVHHYSHSGGLARARNPHTYAHNSTYLPCVGFVRSACAYKGGLRVCAVSGSRFLCTFPLLCARVQMAFPGKRIPTQSHTHTHEVLDFLRDYVYNKYISYSIHSRGNVHISKPFIQGTAHAYLETVICQSAWTNGARARRSHCLCVSLFVVYAAPNDVH